MDAGDVEVVGDGRVGGTTHAFTTKPGDTVLYSKFGLGATELQVRGSHRPTHKRRAQLYPDKSMHVTQALG